MENIDFTQVLPDGVMMMLGAGGILLLSVAIVLIIIIAQRWKGRFLPLLLGGVSYLIVVFIFTNLFTSALAMIPSVDVVFQNDPLSYNIVYNIVAVATFTISRVLMAHMFVGRFERKGDIYLGGIGLGLGDAVLYGITAITYYTASMGIQASGLESLFSDMTPEQMTSSYESLAALFVAPAFLWLLNGISCVLDLVLNIALMNAVYGAVKKYCPSWTIWATAGINFASSLSFQLFDQQSPISIAIWFAVKLIIFAASMYYLVQIVGKEIKYSED